MKYYQQSLMTLANTRTQEEKQSIKVACQTFIQLDQKMNQKFFSCSKADQELILDYLLSGKGTIHSKMINRFDSLHKDIE